MYKEIFQFNAATMGSRRSMQVVCDAGTHVRLVSQSCLCGNSNGLLDGYGCHFVRVVLDTIVNVSPFSAQCCVSERALLRLTSV